MNGIPWMPYTYRGTGTDTLTAWMDELPAPPRKGTGRATRSSCGTDAAYRRHLRNGERCEICAEGNRVRWQFRKDKINASRRVKRENSGLRWSPVPTARENSCDDKEVAG